MEMNKQKFLKFVVDEIERQQKDMYKTGEGKKVVAVLTQIYTMASDGKFDVYSNRGEEISEEIKNVQKGHIHGNYRTSDKRQVGKITGPWNHDKGDIE